MGGKRTPVLAFTLGVPIAPRSAVEAMIEKIIAALDEIDGDPDLKSNDDEGEPNFRKRRRLSNSQRRTAVPGGPGCPISDPAYGIEDMPQGDVRPRLLDTT